MTTLTATRTVPRRRVIFIALGLIIAAIAITGFWPTYFGPLVYGSLVQPLLIHIHSIVFTGWLVLFVAQAVFAATGRTRLHIRLGYWGVGYGCLLIVVGLTTGVLRAAARETDGARLLFSICADMTMFVAFFGAAVYYRRLPQLHKRLMTVAAITLLVAAVSRMQAPYFPDLPLGRHLTLLIWCLPLLIAMAHDYWHRRTVHAVYLLGLATLFVRRFGPPLVNESPQWTAFADWVFRLVQ